MQLPEMTVERIALVSRDRVPPDATRRQAIPLPLDRTALVLDEQAPPPPDMLAECRVLLASPDSSVGEDELQRTEPERTEPERTGLATIQAWVADQGAEPPGHLMTFQGVQICWSPARIGIMAPPERQAAIRDTLVELTCYELELGQIEAQLAASWPELEADSPLAFEFGERSLRNKDTLRRRFHQVQLLRARLARIGGYVHAPHQYPPTLASQLNERLRERTRMIHRHEVASEQLEVFASVYEQAGQRAADYVHTRSGNLLEWVIIILLVAQTLLSLMEILSQPALPATVQPAAAQSGSAS